MEDTEAPVSSKGKADSMVPDSLEFDTNTSRDPQDQTMSLQELIDAELTNRLSPQDSLEVVVPLKDGQADLESLISSDSIEDELRIKKEDADQLISLDSVESVNIDVTNSNKLSLNLDDLAKAEVESGIEVLSPNKVNAEDLSLPSGCHDSLESSSDLPGSPARSTPDPASPSAAQQTFGHQTLAPVDDLGLNSSVDKSNSSSAEDSTAATTVIPQTDDLLGLDSSFTNVSYSVQTVSNSSLEENLLESFSSVPSTFQKQGTLESYDDACGGFDIMDDSELYMDDEKGTRTETTSKIHVVTRDTDLPRSYSIVSEGFNEEEEFEIESNLMGTEESDLLTNVDGNRELGIDKNIDQILVDVDTKKTDFEEFSDAAEKEFESSADILASLTCKEDLKIVEDQVHPEMGENSEETKESNETEAFETKDLEIVENHINDNSTKEDKDLDIFGENQDSSIEPDKEKMETAAEVGITKTTDDDSVLEVDLLNAENVMTTGSVKIIVTEEKDERRDSDCDLRRASDGELVIVEDSTTQGNPEDQMESDLTQEIGQPSDAEVQLPHYYEAPKRTETKASQSSKELCSSEAELIQVSQETSSAEAFDELIIVEDTDKVNTEITKISENERTVVDKHGGSTHEGQTSTDSFSNEKSADVLENTPQEVVPDTPSSNQIKSDLEKAENSTSAKSEVSEATPDTISQDLVDTSNPLTSDNTPSTPGRDKSLNSTVLSSEKMHGGVGDDLLTSNDNVSKQEAPNTNADMRRRAYESDEEEEGFFGNDDDLPSLKPKKGEEEDEEPPEEDEDEEAARTAFLMKMADGYEGEEREAVEAFIRSKLEQEKADKDEGDKAAEDESEKKKKKKKRSEGGEKKSRKKKKKSDDKTSAYLHSASQDDSGRDSGSEGRSHPSKEEIVRPSVSIHQLMGAYTSPTKTAASKPEPPRVDKELPPEGTLHSRLNAYSAVSQNNSKPATAKEEINVGVSFSALKNAYVQSANKSRPPSQGSDRDCNGLSSPLKEEVNLSVSLTQLRETYCNTARSSSTKDDVASASSSSASKTSPVVSTGVKIKDLRRSYTDLTRIPSTTTATAEDRVEKRGRENDTDSYRVSVRDLRASYGDLSRLADSPPFPGGRFRTPSPSPRSRSFGVMSRSTSQQNLGLGQQPLSLPACNSFSNHSSASSSASRNAHKACDAGQPLQEWQKPDFFKSLKKRSYCDLTRVQAPSPNPPKTPDLQWVEGSVQRMDTKKDKKAAYNRDELYEKHVGPRIRSFDASKMKNKFEKTKAPSQPSSDCRMCGKQVFQMEKIVAEKATWHKNCFRCKECNKNLTLETYQSHEGALYCKPHFKELFRPKAVVEDEATARKDRLSRRPRMIVLESQPEQLPDDVVRATDKPDYGLEELQTNVREKFAMFETASKEEEETKLEPVSVRRSQSLLSRVARFQRGDSGEEYGVENSELGEYEDEEDEEGEEEEEEEEFDDENADPDLVRPKKKKKERPMSIGNMGDLKAAWETKNRRAEMAQNRKEELAKFRQMLCAGKNLTLKEMFESGSVDGEKTDKAMMREEIKIDGKRAASSLKEKFEQGRPFFLEDEENGVRKANGEREEVEEIFKEAETAHKARNIFKQIDSRVTKEGLPVMRSHSFAQGANENRLSRDMSQHCLYSRPENQSADVIKANEEVDDFHIETSDLASRFKFFATYEDRLKEESKKNRKVFRFTPPRDGTVKGLGGEDQEIGRDPNLIRCSDNYQDDVDCKNTRNVLAMFKKMELQANDDDDEAGPKPLKRFTPPPDGEYDDEDEYSDEEYSDEEYSDEEDEDEEDSEGGRKSKYQDEVLEMAKQARKKSPQSAKKAASLRAKFERWESDQNEVNVPKEDDEECMPSIDTAKNLKAMFETKAQEVLIPKVQQPKVKVNRFVGGGGDKCFVCDKTVYAMEKLELQGKILHKSCFRCCKCNTKLSMGSFSMGGDRMYCTTHYKQLFAEKGTYEVFSPNGTGKWARKIEATPNNEETEPKSNS